MLTAWTDTYLDISQNSIKADNEISYPWTIYTHHECPGSISTSGNGIHFTPCLPCDVTDCYVVETILAWAEMKGKGLWVVFEVPNFFLSFLFFFVFELSGTLRSPWLLWVIEWMGVQLSIDIWKFFHINTRVKGSYNVSGHHPAVVKDDLLWLWINSPILS